jgi:hypothetical protein
MEDHSMIGDKRKYTLSEKSFRKQIAKGWIGTVFGDHGRIMETVNIGQRYKDGNQWVIDVEAVEIVKNEAKRCDS